MNRTIVVEGDAILSINPDWVIISMYLTTIQSDYNMALRQASRNQEQLLNALKQYGFTNVETGQFRVEPIYQENDNSLLKGYRIVNQLTLNMPYQEAILNQVIQAIHSSQVPVEFSFQFTVADEKKYQEILLSQAVEDATRKANILSQASNTSLGSVVTIDATSPMIRPFSRMELSLSSKADIDFSFQPEKIILTTHVIMTWNLF